MKFKLTRTSDWHDTNKYVEITSLDELLLFCKKNGDTLIIDTEDEVPEIEIYDDYRE